MIKVQTYSWPAPSAAGARFAKARESGFAWASPIRIDSLSIRAGVLGWGAGAATAMAARTAKIVVA